MQTLLYHTLRLIRDILVRLQALCWFVGLPLGLGFWIIGSMLDWFVGETKLLNNCIIFGLIGALTSFTYAAAVIKLRPLIETRMAALLPIRRGSPNEKSPEILYLRSFRTDRFTAGEYIDFEEILLQQLKTPVIAVSNPGSAEPRVGALRVRLKLNDQSTSDWQVHVKEMVRKAKLVLIVFDDSPGVLAEIAITQELEALPKTAIVMHFPDYLSWATLLQMLPDEVIQECIRQLPPSPSTMSDLSRILAAPHVTNIKQRSRSPAMINRYRESFRRAKARQENSRVDDPAGALRFLSDANCPPEMLLLIHALVFENVSGITFGMHFRLWKTRRRPPDVRIWGGRDTSVFSLVLDWIGIYKRVIFGKRQALRGARDLGQLAANMVEHLSTPPNSV